MHSSWDIFLKLYSSLPLTCLRLKNVLKDIGLSARQSCSYIVKVHSNLVKWHWCLRHTERCSGKSRVCSLSANERWHQLRDGGLGCVAANLNIPFYEQTHGGAYEAGFVRWRRTILRVAVNERTRLTTGLMRLFWLSVESLYLILHPLYNWMTFDLLKDRHLIIGRVGFCSSS